MLISSAIFRAMSRCLPALCLAILPFATLAADDAPKVIALGLAAHQVTAEEAEKGGLPSPHFNTPAVAYALAGNLQKGDSVEIALKLGGEVLLHNIATLDKDEPSFLLQAGKTGVPAGGWPEGNYTAEVKITRDGKVLLDQSSKPQPFD